MIKKILAITFLLILIATPIKAYNEGRSDFQLVHNNSLISYEIYSIFVLPGEEVSLDVYEPDSKDKFSVQTDQMQLIKNNNYSWKFKAPNQAGNYYISVINQKNKERINLNVFVLEPYNRLENGYINGYRIGKYPIIPDKLKDNYSLPKGFIRVTRENEEIYLTPHFQLKQFICKQKSNYPKYIVLRELLLNKLEYLLYQINQKGYNADTFHVMSGYRTPYYNASLGNVPLSRHIFGDAADIYIDVNPKDGHMDDLNGDGKINLRDADILYDQVEESSRKREYEEFVGGLSSYRKTASHSPFIHIDTRGFKARW